MSGTESKTQQVQSQAEQVKEKTVVTKITSLFLNQKQLYNLNDLPDTLRVLHAKMNFISDISPIALLKNLYSLNLSNNKIVNLKPLENLPNMQILNLSNNNISDISQIQHCHKLTDLFVAKNYLNSIDGIQYLNELIRLDISNNILQDIQVLSKVSKLIDLNLQGNKITTTVPLGSLKNLLKLNINDNPIEILSLINLVDLEHLHMRSTNQNLNDLQHLYKLQNLDISNNGLKSIEIINNLTNLEVINISGNQIENIDLNHLKELKSLDAGLNDISQLSNFCIPQLSCLNFDYTQIRVQQLYKQIYTQKITYLSLIGIPLQYQDLYTISQLTNLTYLNLKECKIKRIDVLTLSQQSETKKKRNLISLKCLDVSFNEIKNVDSLSKLVNLTHLNISNNQIKRISKLSKLIHLKSFFVFNNDIMDSVDFLSGNLRQEAIQATFYTSIMEKYRNNKVISKWYMHKKVLDSKVKIMQSQILYMYNLMNKLIKRNCADTQ
ncbi:leucine-rich_repeat domain-containing protein [Hexamita inflata]|uniref:Leucine-rich repeat domain-containing protein n=1 Tax=Hexamita inflata TaxID=28002 RepID=A0AA86UKT2_9EUKA|nr:leucine-rich repeat domain-containing protein [Hexamita inflata]